MRDACCNHDCREGRDCPRRQAASHAELEAVQFVLALALAALLFGILMFLLEVLA